jgi:nucleoid-associated protein YgaU
MKITEIDNYKNYITNYDLANMFNVYTDNKLGPLYKTYNLNRSITIKGIGNIPATSITTYKVKESDTLNKISFDLYGTIELWWLLAKINNIKDACINLQPGWVLYTLNKSVVNQILIALKT